ncbi:putative Fungal N-terminal domain-containing protein [Seiridium unicorne]|uniref:Fungal N-terminal domain-containing protein n=1 Tax=Seiridium unicorne TaxID=138068 RepID=A0ABR2UW91_9PEZI
MKELNSLDLSGIPGSFRAKIDQYSAQILDDVQGYRKTIERYEKSMGKSSERGWFSSAPRKVQWAFSAAQDLAAFRQSLSAQLDLVKINTYQPVEFAVIHFGSISPFSFENYKRTSGQQIYDA